MSKPLIYLTVKFVIVCKELLKLRFISIYIIEGQVLLNESKTDSKGFKVLCYPLSDKL